MEKKESYHGGQLNGVCVRRLMVDYDDIIHEISLDKRFQSRLLHQRKCPTGMKNK